MPAPGKGLNTEQVPSRRVKSGYPARAGGAGLTAFTAGRGQPTAKARDYLSLFPSAWLSAPAFPAEPPGGLQRDWPGLPYPHPYWA